MPLLGLCLDPQWDSKISKNRFLRRLKIRFGKAHENQSQKGDFLRSLTCLNCVRGVQNQGFDVFTNSSNMEPKLARFWGQFGLPKRPKAFKRRLMFWGTISGVKKVTRGASEKNGSWPWRPLREDLPASLRDILKTLREDNPGQLKARPSALLTLHWCPRARWRIGGWS